MRRRSFLSSAGLTALSATSVPVSILEMTKRRRTRMPALLKPGVLRDGATIGLISPGSPTPPERIDAAIENLTKLGYTVKSSPNLRAVYGHLAGSDAQRVSDVHWAFSDPEITAIWCVRGGYGCGRILPDLDYELIRRHPKPLLGYSDITALHIGIHQRTGLVTFHSPVAVSEYPEDTLGWFRAILCQTGTPTAIKMPDPLGAFEKEAYRPFGIMPGKATGKLTGGNLCLLASLTGTAFTPVFSKKIVFLEDIAEQPYRVDRMLTQLLQGTDLKEAAGIVLGIFINCEPDGTSASLDIPQTLRDRLGNLSIPVAYGFPLGHIAHQATYPYGINVTLDADAGTLTFHEAAVR